MVFRGNNSACTQGAKPLILLYNPKVAKPGYHRLPHSLLQLGALLEGRYSYEIVDGNLDQGRDRAAEIIETVNRCGVRYLGVTIMARIWQDFPAAKVIQIVRRPEDVLASAKHMNDESRSRRAGMIVGQVAARLFARM